MGCDAQDGERESKVDTGTALESIRSAEVPVNQILAVHKSNSGVRS